MALTNLWALGLLLSVPIALWLLRRGAERRARVHALWFLLPPSQAVTDHSPVLSKVAVLWLLMIGCVAFAAAGPFVVKSSARRALVVDASHQSPASLARTKRRLAALGRGDLAVVVRPGRKPELMNPQEAAGSLVMGAGTADFAALEAGASLAARHGATIIATAATVPAADNAGIVSAEFRRDALQPLNGRFVVTVGARGASQGQLSVVARGRSGELWRRSADLSSQSTQTMEIVYEGAGAELVELSLVGVSDELPTDDRTWVEVPPLRPLDVYVSPTLAESAYARALRVLDTVRIVSSPHSNAVAVIGSVDQVPSARTLVVVLRHDAPESSEPLVAVPESPLSGLTPTLLAGQVAPVPAMPASAVTDVWLRAAGSPAIAAGQWSGIDAVFLPGELPLTLIPIVLADLFDVTPARPALQCEVIIGGALPVGLTEEPQCRVVRPVWRAPTEAAEHGKRPVSAFGVAERAAWPTQLALIVVVLLLVIEIAWMRPKGRALVARCLFGLVVGLVIASATRSGIRRVVVLIDVSDSTRELGQISRLVARELQSLDSEDEVAAVVFAGGAHVVQPLGTRERVYGWLESGAMVPPGLDTRRTDMGLAFDVAGSLLGARAGEVVLISDGNGTERRAESALARPGLAGHSVRFVPIVRGDVGRVNVPATPLDASQGRVAIIPVTVELLQPATVKVVAQLGATDIASQTLALAAGESVVGVPVVLNSGLHEVAVVADIPGDVSKKNNRAVALVRVRGKRNVVIVDNDSLAELPLRSADLREFAAVALDNVAVSALGTARAKALASYVRDGGVLVVSGTQTMRRGGYRGSALEALMPLQPVHSDGELALALVIDRSGSIDEQARVPGTSKLPNARELAALASGLGPRDRFGVISFDAAPAVLREMTVVGSGEAKAFPSLPEPTGGTDPSAALRMAQRMLASAPARAHRVVALVTDGGFVNKEAVVSRVADALADAGVQLLLVPVGAPTRKQQQVMARVAGRGRGRVLALRDWAELPAVVAADRAHSQTAVATVRAVGRQLFGGARWSRRPRRYVAMDVAPGSAVLADVGNAPLLATRVVERGTVVACAANLSNCFANPPNGVALATAVAEWARLPEAGAIRVDQRVGGSLVEWSLPGSSATAVAQLMSASGEAASVPFRRLDPKWSQGVLPPVSGRHRLTIREPSQTRLAQLSLVDFEHRPLAENRVLSELSRSRPQVPHRRLRRYWSLWCAAVLLMLLGVLVVDAMRRGEIH